MFIRNRNGISLTREAEKILPHIRILLHSNEILEQEIDRIYVQKVVLFVLELLIVLQ